MPSKNHNKIKMKDEKISVVPLLSLCIKPPPIQLLRKWWDILNSQKIKPLTNRNISSKISSTSYNDEIYSAHNRLNPYVIRYFSSNKIHQNLQYNYKNTQTFYTYQKQGPLYNTPHYATIKHIITTPPKDHKNFSCDVRIEVTPRRKHTVCSK